MQTHAGREDLLNYLVLQVGRDTVAVLHERQLDELVLQPCGFPGAGRNGPCLLGPSPLFASVSGY